MAYLYQRRVAFADTDAAGYAHFSKILCYVEEAEHTLLSDLKIPLMKDGGWPRVHVECDYFLPLTAGDNVEIILIPKETGRTSITWNFSILRDGEDIAHGNVKTVRVNTQGNPSEILPHWKTALEKV